MNFASPYPISFQAADLRPLDPHALSRQLRVSRAFVELCLVSGCPLVEGRQSAAALLYWLFEHYPEVREAAGMGVLAPVDGVEGEAAVRLKMGNGLLTLLEYSHMRASDPGTKSSLREISVRVERLLDRA